MEAEKAKLREGDSARAKFFRHKDSVFGDGKVGNKLAGVYVDLDPSKGLTEEGSKVMEALMPAFKEVRTVIEELNKDPEDQAALERGVAVLDGMVRTYGEMTKGA